jgi:hypothetical protein
MSDTSHFVRALEAALEAALFLSFADPRLARVVLVHTGRMLITAYGLAQLSAATVANVEDTDLDVLDIALRRIARGHEQLLAQLAGQTAAWSLALSVDPAHVSTARANLLDLAREAGPLSEDPRAELVADLGTIERITSFKGAVWSHAASLALLVARLGLHLAAAPPPVPTTRPAPPANTESEEECDA